MFFSSKALACLLTFYMLYSFMYHKSPTERWCSNPQDGAADSGLQSGLVQSCRLHSRGIWDAKVIIPLSHVEPLQARPGEEVLSSFCDSQDGAGAGADHLGESRSSSKYRKWKAVSKSWDGLVDLIVGMNFTVPNSVVQNRTLFSIMSWS